MVAIPTISAPMPTVEAIYRAYEEDRENEYRSHLGASLIGDPCERSLWYSFRWATSRKFEGRMLRLFDTGHREEARLIADLRRVGVEVYEYDPENPNKQISVRDEFGHFGGSADGVGIGIKEAPKTWHVLEFKTHNDDSFNKLKKKGVRESKPEHFAQMQVYMHFLGLTRAFYLARNKDTDALYSERIEYDPEFAIQLVVKANRVIQAHRLPRKISNDPSWYQCKLCDHYQTCHGSDTPPRHCRSCIHSTPVQGGTWTCNLGQDAIETKEGQEKGCKLHLYQIDLIHGEVVKANKAANTIKYRLSDGTEWTDGQ